MEAGFHPTQVVEVETKYLRELKARRAEHYLCGPIRIGDIHAAAKMGGSCLALLLAIHHRGTVTGRDAVTLPTGYLSDFGISPTVKWHCLRALEAVKFITVKRTPGHSAVIKLTTRARMRRRTT
jgi:hypothetical protein